VEPKEEEVFGPAMEGAPSVPRKPPLSQRIMEVVLRIYIPPKVIITTIAVIVVSLLLYVVADYVRNLVPLPTYSVLILPAQASTAESDAEYTPAGLTADLISDLCSVRDLRVIAPTTSNFFRGSRDSPVQLARSVGANYVLKWSVSKSPQGVVVHVDLSDTISSRTILNSRYQNSLRELPALRLEIARALVEKMGLNPFAQGGELVKKPPTSVPAATVGRCFSAVIRPPFGLLSQRLKGHALRTRTLPMRTLHLRGLICKPLMKAWIHRACTFRKHLPPPDTRPRWVVGRPRCIE
jgi:TolB-like protein